MARDVNVTVGTPTLTGSSVSVPQYTLTVSFQWIDNAGISRANTQTILFPNVLSQIPNARLIEVARDLIIERARTVAAVDA